MIRMLVLLGLVFTLFACKKEDIDIIPDNPTEETDTIPVYLSNIAYDLKDVKYGTHPQQVIDVYLPANRTEATQVFVLIHGGGWTHGSKEDFQYLYNTLRQHYPQCAIINIGYRLATVESPGYPKQMNDIRNALQFMQHPNFLISNEYFLFGSSAGGHLAMLYGYKFDELNQVKGICNQVGPTDFLDPSYTEDPQYEYGLLNFVGNHLYSQNPELYKEVSPAWQVTATSPPTLSFFGELDPLTPSTQMNRLHDRLDSLGVPNEKTLYSGEAHGGWNQENTTDFQNKVVQFLQTYFLP